MATIRKLQSKANKANAISVNTTISLNGVGTFLLVFSGTSDSGATQTISDTIGLPWVDFSGPIVGGAPDVCNTWYAFSTASGPCTITITKDAGVQFINIMVDEFSGVDPVDILDNSAFLTGNSTTPSTTFTSVGSSKSMAWAACNDSLTLVGTGFTKGADDGSSDWTEWKAINDNKNAGSVDVGFTGGGGSWNFAAVTLLPQPDPSFKVRSIRPAPFKPGLAR